jgi:hypothetical protein
MTDKNKESNIQEANMTNTIEVPKLPLVNTSLIENILERKQFDSNGDESKVKE